MLPDNVTGGAHTRLLSFSAPKNIIDSQSYKFIREKIKCNYGFAFPLVIEKINQLDANKLRDFYNSIVKFFDEGFSNVLEEHRRYVSIITVAVFLLSIILFEPSDEEQKMAYLCEAYNNAKEIFSFIPSRVEVADVNREEAVIRDFVVKNQTLFLGSRVELEHMPFVYGKLNDSDGFAKEAVIFESVRLETTLLSYKSIIEQL